MSDDITRTGGVDGAGGAGDGSAEGMLDRYLDGLMTGEERARFEAELAGNAGARGAVGAQRRIDARLRVLFAPPARIEIPAAGVVGRIGEAGGASAGAGGAESASEQAAEVSVGRVGPAGRRTPRWIGLAAAAGLAVVAAGGAGYWWFVIGSAAPYRQPAEIYQAQAGNGFTPEWVCTTDEEFVRTVRERFGEPGLLPMATVGVEVIGWAYNTPVLSNRTATLMTRVDGREVLVLIDSAEKDVNLRRAGEAAGVPELRVFKRRLGGLVLYEVTPLDEARVIGEFVRGE